MNTDKHRWSVRALGIALLSVVACSSMAATEIPPGKWSFTFIDTKGRSDRPMRVYTYRPRQCASACPLQFVLHGMTRNASTYRDYWEGAADLYGIVIVAPEFSQRDWPGTAGYNLGDVESQPDREKWGFSAIEHLFDEVREGRSDYRIFGHSAGAQFVQRMMLLRPDHRASVAVAANPGWYTMPEWRKDRKVDAFPFSLVGARVGEPELRKALERRFVLMVGEKDNDPNHRSLENSEGAKKQGAHRLERGENFFKAATMAANELGVKMNWQFMEIPETAHSGSAMSRHVAQMIYGKQ